MKEIRVVGKLEVTKHDCSHLWKTQLRAFLKSKNRGTRGLITQTLSMNQIPCIQMTITAKKIIKQLRKDYELQGMATQYFRKWHSKAVQE